MKKLFCVSQSYIAFVDDEDFERVSKYKWYSFVQNKKPDQVKFVTHLGKKKSIELKLNEKKNNISLQRLILNVFDDKKRVVNLDSNLLNCTKSNLKVFDYDDRNFRKRPISSTGYVGVYKDKVKKNNKYFKVMIFHNGSLLTIKTGVKTPKEGAIIYNQKAKELLGDKAFLNEI